MVGSNGTMIAIRLVRSKLRKREDHHENSAARSDPPAMVQTTTLQDGRASVSTTTTTVNATTQVYATSASGNVNEAFSWQFPPPYPPPRTPPPQYALYNDQVSAHRVLKFGRRKDACCAQKHYF